MAPVGPFSNPVQPRRTSFNYQVGIGAAVRSPRPEIRSRAILDYGVATGQEDETTHLGRLPAG